MTLEYNKLAFRRFWDELFNQRKLAVADELLAPNFANHALLLPDAEPPTPISPGPGPMKYFVEQLGLAFPDGRWTVEDMIAEGDKVAGRVTMTGTHLGKSATFPFAPTGKSFRRWQMHIFRYEDGKIAEHWAVRDDLSLLHQIGIVSMHA